MVDDPFHVFIKKRRYFTPDVSPIILLTSPVFKNDGKEILKWIRPIYLAGIPMVLLCKSKKKIRELLLYDSDYLSKQYENQITKLGLRHFMLMSTSISNFKELQEKLLKENSSSYIFITNVTKVANAYNFPKVSISKKRQVKRNDIFWALRTWAEFPGLDKKDSDFRKAALGSICRQIKKIDLNLQSGMTNLSGPLNYPKLFGALDTKNFSVHMSFFHPLNAMSGINGINTDLVHGPLQKLCKTWFCYKKITCSQGHEFWLNFDEKNACDKCDEEIIKVKSCLLNSSKVESFSIKYISNIHTDSTSQRVWEIIFAGCGHPIRKEYTYFEQTNFKTFDEKCQKCQKEEDERKKQKDGRRQQQQQWQSNFNYFNFFHQPSDGNSFNDYFFQNQYGGYGDSSSHSSSHSFNDRFSSSYSTEIKVPTFFTRETTDITEKDRSDAIQMLLTHKKNPRQCLCLTSEQANNKSNVSKHYKIMAMLVHPDKNKGNKNSTEAFKILISSYEILYKV